MPTKTTLNVTSGKVAKYAQQWNPFSMTAYVVVKVDEKTVEVPVDRRQVRFLGKEYPVGSRIRLGFDGRWHIRSQLAPAEFDMTAMFQRLY